MLDVQRLNDCVRRQPMVDLRQSNAMHPASTPAPFHAEPDESCCSDASSLRSEGQIGSSLATGTGPGTTVSDVQKQNCVKDVDVVQNEPHQTHNASDRLPLDNEVFATEKHPVKFKGIGPTDEETGSPIASRTVSKARMKRSFLWPPYIIGQATIFLPCGFFFFFYLLFSSPNLSGRKLGVHHSSTHGVAVVRI